MKPTSKEVINELSKILDATPKEIKGFMGPREKAKDLVEKFNYESKHFLMLDAKKFALIAVHELIEQCWDYREIDLEKSCDYWKEVKQEIEKL